jgi:hypothetical protein
MGAGGLDDDDPTAEGYLLDGDVVDVTTPVARAAKRRASIQSPVGAPAEAAEPVTEGKMTSPTASIAPAGDDMVLPASAPTPASGARGKTPSRSHRGSGAVSAIHSHPTQQIPTRVTGEGETRYSTAVSPIHAMRDDEINRMRGFLKLVALAAAGTVIAIALTPGDPIARTVVYAGCGVVGVVSLILLWLFRPDGSG